jgi:hypothetical protein
MARLIYIRLVSSDFLSPALAKTDYFYKTGFSLSVGVSREAEVGFDPHLLL